MGDFFGSILILEFCVKRLCLGHDSSTTESAAAKYVQLVSRLRCPQVRLAGGDSRDLSHQCPALEIVLAVFDVGHHARPDWLNVIPRGGWLSLGEVLLEILCRHSCFN